MRRSFAPPVDGVNRSDAHASRLAVQLARG
jgi:hypothetical protein